MTLILASASPRRRELLARLGCDFTAMASNVDEVSSYELPPCELVVKNARAKAKKLAEKLAGDAVILGADTLVVLNGKVFGKPRTVDKARYMLSELSGQMHEVLTGVAVIRGSRELTECVTTKVWLARLTEKEITRYIDSGEPLDKAGSYAIQGRGALLVDKIEGCYFNVVGLPLRKVACLLREVGVNIL